MVPVPYLLPTLGGNFAVLKHVQIIYESSFQESGRWYVPNNSWIPEWCDIIFIESDKKKTNILYRI